MKISGVDSLGMEFDLRVYARVLLKRKWYIAGCLAAFIAIGAFMTITAAPLYQAKATLFVGDRQVSAEQVNAAVQQSKLSTALLKSYAEILRSRSIAGKAVQVGGLDLTPGQVVGGLGAQALPSTQVIALTFTGIDAEDAAQATNAVARAFISEIARLESPDGSGTQPAVQVSVIDEAVTPGSPIWPDPVRNITLATLLGLIAGVGLAFLVDHLDVSVKSREDLEQLGLPVIGSIPALDTEGEEIHLESDTQGMGGESFRKLRTSIGFLGLESPVKAILITSAVAQEGKTTLALNLAAAYALGGFRTLLLEADLRRPSLHRFFGTYGTRGLTTVIVGSVAIEDAIVHTKTRNLAVMLAGAIPPNPVELLGSEQMIDVLTRLRQSFDVVVIDSPPLGPVADPATLAGLCDGVVMVAKAGGTDRRRLLEGVQIIGRAGGRLLGVALNFLSAGSSADDYEYYYYGYRSSKVPVDEGSVQRG